MEVLVLLIVFGTIAFIAYLFFNARHKERMALLEYSKDASVFVPKNQRMRSGLGALKFGLVLVFAGTGLLLSYFLTEVLGFPEELAVFSMIFLGGGLGLIAFYQINQKKLAERRHEEQEEEVAEMV